MTNDVFLFDAVRTPRGRGRPGGGLHEVKPIDLVGTLLQALERRSNLDTERVDDIILGVVNPYRRTGERTAKIRGAVVWLEPTNLRGATQQVLCIGTGSDQYSCSQDRIWSKRFGRGGRRGIDVSRAHKVGRGALG